MVKRQIKKKNKKIKKYKNKKESKNNKKEILALTLAMIAVALLIINALYILMDRNKIISEILNSEEFKTTEIEVSSIIPTIISILVFSWLILALLFSLSIYFIEKGKWKWYSLLILSFALLVLFRIESFILGIISSFLYKKAKK
ncbi:MAG: hypothetical protein QXK80_01875 [Candidatus Pacearchaeota archaeon]